MSNTLLTIKRVGRPPRFVEPELIQELRSSGLSFRQIARRTGYGYGTVRRAYLGIRSTSVSRILGAKAAD